MPVITLPRFKSDCPQADLAEIKFDSGKNNRLGATPGLLHPQFGRVYWRGRKSTPDLNSSDFFVVKNPLQSTSVERI
jgi:hypothetical protein